MMSLVISACLSASPTDCSLFEVGEFQGEGYKACRLQMQQTVELWQIAHPDQIVHSSYCAVGRSATQD